jgi:hypothetical protein
VNYESVSLQSPWVKTVWFLEKTTAFLPWLMVARDFAGRNANLFRIAGVELNVVAAGTTVWSQS